jgi:hypothetical protein
MYNVYRATDQHRPHYSLQERRDTPSPKAQWHEVHIVFNALVMYQVSSFLWALHNFWVTGSTCHHLDSW